MMSTHDETPAEQAFDDPELSQESALLTSISFEGLDSTDFEEFCHDLLVDQGFVNVDWRKGTPKQASPSDRGRDLVGQLERQDVDGHIYLETWFVDCKHYKTGVPPDALTGLMAWAQTERPDVALVLNSGFLSNASKDWIDRYKANNRPPFRIRHWERPQLSAMISNNMGLAWKHGISHSELRPLADIIAAENEMYEKIWYGRKTRDGSPAADRIDPHLRRAMLEGLAEIEAKYGKDALLATMKDDFSWGLLSGKLSTLRWILGAEWDFLDS